VAISLTGVRERKFHRLRSLVAECERDGARAAVVTGASGVGKTAFAQRFVECARNEGALVLTATGSYGAQGRTLGVLEQLLAGYAEHDPLVEVARSPGTPWLSMELALETLVELASTNTVVLVIDNTHLSDTLSLFCLAYFLATMTAIPLLIVLVGSTDLPIAGGVIPPDLRYTHIALESFSELEVQELAEVVIGGQAGAAFARTCHAATGGNPRLVDALLSDGRRRLHPSGADLGEHFTAAMRRCLDGAPNAVREVAAATAVIGDDATPALIGEITSIDPARVNLSLRMLNESGILIGTRFRVAGARELMLSWTDGWDQVRFHRRAVDCLRKDEGTERTVEHHLVSARRLTEDLLKDVLNQFNIDTVDTADVELALRCLDGVARVQVGEWAEPALVHQSSTGVSTTTGRFCGPGDRKLGDAAVGDRASPDQGAVLHNLQRQAKSARPEPVRQIGAVSGGRPAAGGSGESDNAAATLSSAECRVAALAARGHTNRSISDNLSITVSTVEQHLTRVYRKLNIRERRELRPVLAMDRPDLINSEVDSVADSSEITVATSGNGASPRDDTVPRPRRSRSPMAYRPNKVAPITAPPRSAAR